MHGSVFLLPVIIANALRLYNVYKTVTKWTACCDTLKAHHGLCGDDSCMGLLQRLPHSRVSEQCQLLSDLYVQYTIYM